MKKRNTLIFVTVSTLLALLSSSCMREEMRVEETAVLSEHMVSATCELLPSETGTKSIFTSTKTQIRSVQMFVYNHSTGAYVDNTYTDKGAGMATNSVDINFMMSWIRDNVAYDYYFLVNLPRITRSSIPSTATAMDAYTYTFSDYSTFNSYGFPMAAKYSNIIIGEEPERIYFKRLVSKWTVYCDYSQANNDISLEIIAKSLRVRNAASSVQPFASSPAAPTVFGSTIGDSETSSSALTDLTDDGIVLWVLENRAGNLLGETIGSDEDRKLGNIGSNTNHPTYLEFEMDALSTTEYYTGNKYRYLLGTPSEGDLRDINNFRNRDYYVQMYFTSTSLNGDGWYREVASSVDTDINDDAIVNTAHPSEKVKGIVINYLGETSFNLTAKAQSIIDLGVSLKAEWSDGKGPVGSNEGSTWYNISDGSTSPYMGSVKNQPLLDVSINNSTKKLILSPSDYLRNAIMINPEDEDEGSYEPYIHNDDNALNASSPGSLNCIVNVKRTDSPLYIDIKTTTGVLLTKIPVQLGPSHIRIYNKADDDNPIDGMFDEITYDGGVMGNKNLGTYDFTYPVSTADYGSLYSRGNATVVRNDNTIMSCNASVTGRPKNYTSTGSWQTDYLPQVLYGINGTMSDLVTIIDDEYVYDIPGDGIETIRDYVTTFSGSSLLSVSSPFDVVYTALNSNYNNYILQKYGRYNGTAYCAVETMPSAYIEATGVKIKYKNDSDGETESGCSIFRHHIYPVSASLSLSFHTSDMVCTGGKSLIVASYLSGSGNSSLSYLPTGRKGLKFRHLQEIDLFNNGRGTSWFTGDGTIGYNNSSNGLSWGYYYATTPPSRAYLVNNNQGNPDVKLRLCVNHESVGLITMVPFPCLGWVSIEAPADPSEDQWIDVSMTYTTE